MVEEACESGAIADTYGGRVHIKWDPTAAVTPLGQLPFLCLLIERIFGGVTTDMLKKLGYPVRGPLRGFLQAAVTGKPLVTRSVRLLFPELEAPARLARLEVGRPRALDVSQRRRNLLIGKLPAERRHVTLVARPIRGRALLHDHKEIVIRTPPSRSGGIKRWCRRSSALQEGAPVRLAFQRRTVTAGARIRVDATTDLDLGRIPRVERGMSVPADRAVEQPTRHDKKQDPKYPRCPSKTSLRRRQDSRPVPAAPAQRRQAAARRRTDARTPFTSGGRLLRPPHHVHLSL